MSFLPVGAFKGRISIFFHLLERLGPLNNRKTDNEYKQDDLQKALLYGLEYDDVILKAPHDKMQEDKQA